MAPNGPDKCRRCGRDLVPGVATCPACMFPDYPATFLMMYERGRLRTAQKQAKADVQRLAGFGYQPIWGTMTWTPGKRSTGATIGIEVALGGVGRLVAHLLFPPSGCLSIHYRRSDLTDEAALADLSGGISWTNS